MREQSFKNANNSRPKDIRGGETKVMKKLLSSLLVLALVLTMVVPAFAAPLSDVAGTKFEAAVSELGALGVLNGYTDGTFRPENTITRAEFAKVIVLASGNETMVKYLANSTTKFNDVKVGQWFNGYVAAATAKGFLKGYTDGTFRPDAKITQSEVLTVLVRALGYQDDKLPGEWPYDILIKADELGLMEGVVVDAAAPAIRGDVAIMTSTTIGKNTNKYNADGEEVATYPKLIASLGASYNDVLVSATLDGDDENQLVLDSDVKVVADDFIVSGGKSLDDLLGHDVLVVENKDGKVLILVDNQDSENVTTGVLEADLTEASIAVNLVDVTTDVTLAGAYVYYNGEAMDPVAGFTVPAGADVTVYTDADDNARFVIADMFTVNNKFFENYSSKTTYRDAKVTVSGVSYDVVDGAVVVKDGKESKLASLAVNDIIDLKENSDGKVVEVRATTPTTITGEVTSKVVVSGTTYYVVGGVRYEAVGVTPTVGSEYEMVLNADGKIISLDGIDTTSAQDVIVLSVEPVQILKDSVITPVLKTKLFNVKTGATTTYFEETVNLTAEVGNYGTITFKEDGTFNSFDSLNALDVTDIAATVSDLTVNSITVGGQTYLVDNGTVFVNLYNADGDLAPTLMSFEDLKDSADIYFVTDGGYTLDLVFVEDGGSAAANAVPVVAGVVTGMTSTTTADGTTYEATLNVAGATKTIEVTADPTSFVDKLVRYDDFNLDGEYATPTTATDLTGTLAVSNYVIGGTYLATSTTVVYVVDGDGNLVLGDLADIADLDAAVMGTDADVSVLVAKVLNSDNQPTATDKTLGTYKVLEAVVITLK